MPVPLALAALILLTAILCLRPELVIALFQKDLLVKFLIAVPAIMAGAVLLIGGLVLLAGESELENGDSL